MSDVKTRGDLLYSDKSKVIGKSQIYALLVDASRDPILDASGNEQVVDLEVVAGRLQTDAVATIANLDIALSALRDAIAGSGAGTKTLADLNTNLASILAKVIAAPATETKQDTLIAKDFATQTTLAALLAKVIAAPATEAKQDALAALIGTLADAAVIDPTAAGSVIAELKGIIKQMQGTGTAGTSMPVTLNGSLTRASDTILIGTGAAHSAGDVVSTDAGEILQFETGLPAGTGGMILNSLVTLNQNAVFAGGAGYTLYLFNVSPTVQATNAVFDLDSLTGYVGKIIISTLIDRGSNCEAEDIGHNKSFVLAAGDTKLYGKAVCIGAETTISAKTLTYNLDIMSA